MHELNLEQQLQWGLGAEFCVRVDSSENSLFLLDTDNDTEPDSHLTDRVPAERALEQHLIQSHFGLDCPRLHITHYVSVFPIPPHCLPEKLGRNRN